ncbi:hypothetical protein REB14_18855 [Chryseobacterium sp. ES2]|uniref:Nuclear transport factor 2 family protein n=1 Tax=Chryseobacterium metallicongregator TaxID=3073042 RepID=A0ABU1E8U7_9FLAO|nr:hypothetical protein [Chryseobacterium sp. ES2]MDR4954245.1 hypothetical protein [Chryseobacterium sp. ES2]
MNNIEKLLNSLMEQAELFLKENGVFAPFGTYIRANGDLTYIGAYSETTDSNEMYDLLIKDLKDEDIRATAIAWNGTVDGKDVIVKEVFLSLDGNYQSIHPYIIENGIVVFGDEIKPRINH